MDQGRQDGQGSKQMTRKKSIFSPLRKPSQAVSNLRGDRFGVLFPEQPRLERRGSYLSIFGLGEYSR